MPEDLHEIVANNSIFTKDGVIFFACLVPIENKETVLGIILANSTGLLYCYKNITIQKHLEKTLNSVKR